MKNFLKTLNIRLQSVFSTGAKKIAHFDTTRTQTLEKEIESLKVVARSKDEFIRLTSHELRTPLDAMRGNIYMVLQGETGAISKQTEEYLKDTLSGADRLIHIVNDTLDIARIETGHMKFSLDSIDLTPLFKTFEKEYALFAIRKKMSLSFVVEQNLPAVYSDNVKVMQILTNLVGNAFKFTPAGGSIVVRAKVAEDTVAISVEDTGIGIAKEDIPKLFKQFSEIDTSAANAPKGTGLGLFLSKQLAEKLGGTVRAESLGIGNGATFTFWLPIAGSKRAEALKQFHAAWSRPAVQ